MYDFTWKSFFKVYVVLFAAMYFFLGPTDRTFLPITNFAVTAFLYGAGAPFVVAYLEAYRDERQRGKPMWYCILAGLAGMLGLLLVLVPVGGLVAAIGYVWMAFESGMKQHWLTAAVLAVVSVVLAIAFWTDVVVTRLNINKLRVFKPSNERRIMRR